MKIKPLIILFLLTSCHPLFCTWDYGYSQLKKEPPRNEVVGEYLLNKKSQEYLKLNPIEWTMKLELLASGKYNFKNERNEIQKTGKWSLTCDDSFDCLMELEKISVEPFYEKNGKYAIGITIGDGDECNGIIYEKNE